MLPADDEAAARAAAPLVTDMRARHFFDADRRVGEAVARSLGTQGAAGQTAWDMYLFYDPAARWAQRRGAASGRLRNDGHDGTAPPAAPAPADWLHQLRGRAWA